MTVLEEKTVVTVVTVFKVVTFVTVARGVTVVNELLVNTVVPIKNHEVIKKKRKYIYIVAFPNIN